VKRIKNNKPVLVTGANGYIASWIVKYLLQKNLTVHACVRGIKNKNKTQHLLDLNKNNKGKLVFFETNLLKEGSYDNAMIGCELVFHTASPFKMKTQNPKKDFIEPALKGTKNVLTSATKTKTVKRVVLTSSCAAMYADAIDTTKKPNKTLTEEDWNTKATEKYQPYSYSKTIAEKEAWRISKKQKKWDLVVINPSLVFGPSINPKNNTSGTMEILEMMTNGSMKIGAPKSGVGVVDVRDVADAHIKAGFTPSAKGRYITSAYNTDFLEISRLLIPKYGNKIPLPKKAIPKWFLFLFGPIFDKVFSRRFVLNNVNIPFNADNSKIKKELNIKFKPIKETMEDSIDSLIKSGLIKTKKQKKAI